MIFLCVTVELGMNVCCIAKRYIRGTLFYIYDSMHCDILFFPSFKEGLSSKIL